MQFTDKVSVGGTHQTAEGYPVATARAVRTGTRLYAGRGHEVRGPEARA